MKTHTVSPPHTRLALTSPTPQCGRFSPLTHVLTLNVCGPVCGACGARSTFLLRKSRGGGKSGMRTGRRRARLPNQSGCFLSWGELSRDDLSTHTQNSQRVPKPQSGEGCEFTSHTKVHQRQPAGLFLLREIKHKAPPAQCAISFPLDSTFASNQGERKTDTTKENLNRHLNLSKTTHKRALWRED